MDEAKLTDYFRARMPAASGVRIVSLKRIAGGSSRETYAFDLEWSENGERRTRPLIARRDPAGESAGRR